MKTLSVVCLFLFLSVNVFAQNENTSYLKPLSLNERNEIERNEIERNEIERNVNNSFVPPARSFIAFVGAGLSLPVIEKDFSDDFSAGLNVHGGAGYRLSENQTLRFGIQYNSFPGPGSLDLTITSLRGDLMFGSLTGSPTNIYGYGGIGVYFLDIGGFDETNFGFAGGVGLTFSISSSGSTYGYVETGLDYNVNDGSAKGFIPLKVGVLIIP